MVAAHQLEVAGLCVDRGVLRVVDDASLTVPAGTCTGLLGLNGAGKSSLMAALAGLIPSARGSVALDSDDISALPSWERAKRGLVLVPSGRQLWSTTTVEDTLLLGAHLTRSRDMRRATLDEVFAYFPVLREKRRQRAQELSGGQQQMLALGRALMARPRVLLLDEPSEGLAPVIVDLVFDVIANLRSDRNLTILLAEQNGGMVDICDSVLVMRDGRLGRLDSDRVDLEDVVFEG